MKLVSEAPERAIESGQFACFRSQPIQSPSLDSAPLAVEVENDPRRVACSVRQPAASRERECDVSGP
jgi:hypothetical protein